MELAFFFGFLAGASVAVIVAMWVFYEQGDK